MIIERRESVRETMNGIHLQILEFGHASGGQDWEGNSISPSYTRLYYICAGDGFLTANGETMPLEQGNCYLLPAGFSFSYGCHTSMEQIFFHVRLPEKTFRFGSPWASWPRMRMFPKVRWKNHSGPNWE